MNTSNECVKVSLVFKALNQFNTYDWTHETSVYVKKEINDEEEGYEEEEESLDFFYFSKNVPKYYLEPYLESNFLAELCVQDIEQYVEKSFYIYIVYHFWTRYVDHYRSFLDFEEAKKYFDFEVEQDKKNIEKHNRELKISEDGRILLDPYYIVNDEIIHYTPPEFLIQREGENQYYESVVYDETPFGNGFSHKVGEQTYQLYYCKGSKWILERFKVVL
jgi:hypothetical protein